MNIKINKKKVSDNTKISERIIDYIYKSIFKLNNEDLLIHYNEVKKELEKRGVLNV